MECYKPKTNLKQINNKKTLVNLYKDIVLVNRVRTFSTTLFTNNNIKIVIKSHTFLFQLDGVGSYINYLRNRQGVPNIPLRIFRK